MSAGRIAYTEQANPTVRLETEQLVDGDGFTVQRQRFSDPAAQAALALILAALPGNPATEATLAQVQAGLAALIARFPAALDADGGLKVHTQNPAGGGGGDASAANQATEIARLTSILTALSGTLAVSAASLPLPSGAATDATQGKRFAGGKLAATAQVTASGDTTVLTPSAGKALTVFWVSALNDPDQAASPRIVVKFAGGSEIYRGYAVAHWEPFTGAVNEALKVSLDQAGDVAVTVHYTEA